MKDPEGRVLLFPPGTFPDAGTARDQDENATSRLHALEIHRSFVCTDMIRHFQDDEIMNSELVFLIINERGEREEGVGIGINREVFSLFWCDFANSMTIGERERVPFIHCNSRQFSVDSTFYSIRSTTLSTLLEYNTVQEILTNKNFSCGLEIEIPQFSLMVTQICMPNISGLTVGYWVYVWSNTEHCSAPSLHVIITDFKCLCLIVHRQRLGAEASYQSQYF